MEGNISHIHSLTELGPEKQLNEPGRVNLGITRGEEEGFDCPISIRKAGTFTTVKSCTIIGSTGKRLLVFAWLQQRINEIPVNKK